MDKKCSIYAVITAHIFIILRIIILFLAGFWCIKTGIILFLNEEYGKFCLFGIVAFFLTGYSRQYFGMYVRCLKGCKEDIIDKNDGNDKNE